MTSIIFETGFALSFINAEMIFLFLQEGCHHNIEYRLFLELFRFEFEFDMRYNEKSFFHREFFGV